MKSPIITALLVAATTFAHAQTKHIAPVNVIKLTDKEFLRIDTAVNFALSKIDSKAQSDIFLKMLAPLYIQVNQQMVADSVNKIIPKRK